jgi:hypothetical protein
MMALKPWCSRTIRLPSSRLASFFARADTLDWAEREHNYNVPNVNGGDARHDFHPTKVTG